MTLLALRIVHDVSNVRRINHEIHFAWQAQCLLKVDCDFSVKAQHFVTFWGDSRRATCCNFQHKIVSKMGRVRSPKRRVPDEDFMFGSWSDYPRIVLFLFGSNSRISRSNLERRISWQARYLLSLKDDFTCPAHRKV